MQTDQPHPRAVGSVGPGPVHSARASEQGQSKGRVLRPRRTVDTEVLSGRVEVTGGEGGVRPVSSREVATSSNTTSSSRRVNNASGSASLLRCLSLISPLSLAGRRRPAAGAPCPDARPGPRRRPRPPSSSRPVHRLIRLHPPYTTPRGLPPSFRVTRNGTPERRAPNRPR